MKECKNIKTFKFQFTVIIVTNVVNAKLKKTLDSALVQKFSDVQIIIKFNNIDISNFKSMYKKSDNLIFISSFDNGIYDAMNQALDLAEGKYVYFLNVGDEFYDKDIFSNIVEKSTLNADIIYSPYMYRNTVVNYPKKLTRSFFFRSALCHQAYFIKTNIIQKLKFNLTYKVLADHDLMLRYINQYNIKFERLNKVVSRVDLMGFSANNTHQKKLERKFLVSKHFTYQEKILFFTISFFSMKVLRDYMLKNPTIFKIYNKFKSKIYN